MTDKTFDFTFILLEGASSWSLFSYKPEKFQETSLSFLFLLG